MKCSECGKDIPPCAECGIEECSYYNSHYWVDCPSDSAIVDRYKRHLEKSGRLFSTDVDEPIAVVADYAIVDAIVNELPQPYILGGIYINSDGLITRWRRPQGLAEARRCLVVVGDLAPEIIGMIERDVREWCPLASIQVVVRTDVPRDMSCYSPQVFSTGKAEQ